MSEMVKIGSLLPSGICLRIAQWYKGPDGDPLVKDIAVHTIAGSGRHIGYAPGNLHEKGADVPYTEIPAAHWALWHEMNKEGDLYRSGAVFKHDDEIGDHEEGTDAKPIAPLPHPQHMEDGELEAVTRPGRDGLKPTEAHDEAYREFKDHAGQEAEQNEPTLRGKSKDEVDEKQSVK